MLPRISRLLLPFLLLNTSPLPATPPDLSGPLRVELHDGRIHSGQPVAFRDDRLYLRTRLGAGEVERGFSRPEIARLHFPGETVAEETARLLSDENRIDALPLLEALWRQRAPFLSLLEKETLQLLAALPESYLDSDDFYGAIAFANRLLPHLTDDRQTAGRLQEAILLSHLHLKMYEETRHMAEDWIRQAENPPNSALGWRILAELALQEHNLDEVIWLSLQPIAFTGPDPMPHLDHCYALAIHAYHAQEKTTQAAVLFSEMQSLGILWPQEERFRETGEIIAELVPQKPPSNTEPATPDLDLRPPEQDLNLPIQKIRKLLQPDLPEIPSPTPRMAPAL